MPPSIAAYPVISPLAPDATYLAHGPGGRQVVLKRMDADCLLGAQLHPSIRQRLARVRELPHGSVANFHGVVEDAHQAYLVWEFLPGDLWADWVADEKTTRRDVLLMARELVVAVEALHAQGLVHGAIHGRNIIIDDRRRLRLTHISPLLYNETQQDLAAAESLIDRALERWGPPRVVAPCSSLRELGARLAALADARPGAVAEAADDRSDHGRRLMLLAAAGLAVAAVALYWFIRRHPFGLGG